jgi:hypothetical protein
VVNSIRQTLVVPNTLVECSEKVGESMPKARLKLAVLRFAEGLAIS